MSDRDKPTLRVACSLVRRFHSGPLKRYFGAVLETSAIHYAAERRTAADFVFNDGVVQDRAARPAVCEDDAQGRKGDAATYV